MGSLGSFADAALAARDGQLLIIFTSGGVILTCFLLKTLNDRRIESRRQKAIEACRTSTSIGGNAAATVVDLMIYPVKSCGSIKLSSAQLCSTGFRYDRRWMIIDAVKRKMVSQRNFPRMALIKPIIEEAALVVSDAEEEADMVDEFHEPKSLILSVEGEAEDITVPVLRLEDENAKVFHVKVWDTGDPDDDARDVVDQGDAVSEWLTRFLQSEYPLRLVYMDDGGHRYVTAKYRAPGESGRLSFADGMQYLIASIPSLHELHKKGCAVPMNRFRPNIVVDSCQPFDEDTWRKITIGDTATFYGVKHCTRCIVPTTNQQTAKQGGVRAEPLVTLRQFRRDKNLSGKVVFGENLEHVKTWSSPEDAPVLKLGDSVRVLETKERGQIGGGNDGLLEKITARCSLQ